MRRILLILFACLTVSAAYAQTDDTIPIQYGDTLAGTITEAIPCQYYRFDGTQGDPITLDMKRTSGSLDGVLALYRKDDQTPIATNDDRPGGGLDPLITATLPETTGYTVAACRLQADQMRVTMGEYTLTLTGPDATTAPVTDAATPLSLTDSIFSSGTDATPAPAMTDSTGSQIEGELAADVDAVSYSLDVAAGDTVLIEWQRTDGDLAPRLTVTDADGRVLALASTPDAVSGLALVVLAPADGTLTITITRHGAAQDGSAGAFTLGVEVE